MNRQWDGLTLSDVIQDTLFRLLQEEVHEARSRNWLSFGSGKKFAFPGNRILPAKNESYLEAHY